MKVKLKMVKRYESEYEKCNRCKTLVNNHFILSTSIIHEIVDIIFYGNNMCVIK